MSSCPSGKIRNPKTRRCVRTKSSLGQVIVLLQQCQQDLKHKKRSPRSAKTKISKEINKLTVEELKDACREMRIKGYSGKNKKQLQQLCRKRVNDILAEVAEPAAEPEPTPRKRPIQFEEYTYGIPTVNQPIPEDVFEAESSYDIMDQPIPAHIFEEESDYSFENPSSVLY